MPGTLLNAKLFTPRTRPGTLDRARVSDLLDHGMATKLTLLSAQAGFGKTTAIANWVHQRRGGRGVAWLTLDSGDAHPDVFWTYVVTALARVAPEVAEGVLSLFEGPGATATAMLTELVNRLGDLSDDVVLVLDDYHLVDTPAIAGGVAFLLAHLPPQAHLVISTRADPDLPLSRLRIRGELVELRAADLRFTGQEATSYVHDAGVSLDATGVAVLADRTEGWAAALQLAVLSLRDRPDVNRFIIDVAGSDRFILDYLVEEVLNRQQPSVRDFLVRTSVLDRLTGPLCDAVTGQNGGDATLQWLERQNLFIIPLDARRQWYRYHHLFADVLRAHAAADTTGPPAHALHARASTWYEKDGQPAAAVRHALAAGDHPRAAALMEAAIPGLLRDRQEATIMGWVDALPADVVDQRPVLAMGFVAALMARGDAGSVPRRLDDLQRRHIQGAGAGAASPNVLVEDPSQLDCLPGRAELYRAAVALVNEDLDATHRHVELATASAAHGDYRTRAGAWGLSGLAHWRVGDLEATHRCYSRCIDELLKADHISDVLGCTTTLADIRITQGRLGDAELTLRGALVRPAVSGEMPRGTADMYTGLSVIALERGDLDDAEAQLRCAQQLGDVAGMPQHASQLRVSMALVRAGRGDLDEAYALLDEAERMYVPDFKPDVRPVHATRARLLVTTHQLDDARTWATQHRLSDDDALSYVREYEHITLAMLMRAEYRAGRGVRADDVCAFLDRLHAASASGGRTGSLIEILVLQALTLSSAGRHDEAASHLRLALRLAEPERYARVFTQYGKELGRLVGLLPSGERDAPYVRALVAASTTPGDGSAARGSGPVRHHDLLDPLSQRELEVLRLLATDLSGPELARHLVVSLNTVRTHTRNVYSKLGVNGRRAAVSRARELNLLQRTDG